MAEPDRTVWAAAEGVATLFACAAVTARARLLTHASPLIRMMGQRDAMFNDAALLERELAVFRGQRQRRPAKERPHYAPGQRAEILQVMRLRGWSAKKAGQRFVVHPNTIRNWQRAVEDKLRSERLLVAPPWNRLHEGVRWLVQEMRRVFPEPGFRTRTIARHILRAGIGISRTSVRRILEEEPARPPKHRQLQQRLSNVPKHVQHPTQPGRVWHLDMTTTRALWRTVEIAAIVDGYSRKIVALKAFSRRAKTADLAELVTKAVGSGGGARRFLVTDHGSQFRRRFRRAITEVGITHARFQVHTWQLNAKVERVFRDLKPWTRRAFLVPCVRSAQRRPDGYREWHTRFRPHAAHGTLTPAEVESGASLPEPVVYRQRGGVEPRVRLHRRCVCGDPRLAYPVIRVIERRRQAA